MPLTFPKSARLLLTSEFHRVKKRGFAVGGRFMTLGVLRHPAGEGAKVGEKAVAEDAATAESAAQGPALPAARVGIITTKRIGGAVERNRVRRRFRELLRVTRPAWKPDTWLVLIARSGAAQASFEELQRDWLRLARKAGIFAAAGEKMEASSAGKPDLKPESGAL